MDHGTDGQWAMDVILAGPPTSLGTIEDEIDEPIPFLICRSRARLVCSVRLGSGLWDVVFDVRTTRRSGMDPWWRTMDRVRSTSTPF